MLSSAVSSQLLINRRIITRARNNYFTDLRARAHAVTPHTHGTIVARAYD